MTNFILGTVVGFATGMVIGIIVMSFINSYNKKNRLDDWTD